MGGGDGLGNVTPAAEFNIWFDPEAAARTFDSRPRHHDGRPQRDARRDAHDADVDVIREHRRRSARWPRTMLDYYLDWQDKLYGSAAWRCTTRWPSRRCCGPSC